MRVNVTHCAEVSPYEAVQAMKKELYEKCRCGGLHDDVFFRNGVLYGLRYPDSTFPEATPLNISQETLDVLNALETLSTYYAKKEST